MAHASHHIIPQKTLLKVFLWLVFFTLLTVVTAKYVDIGWMNIPLALAIAGTKAGLVVSIFMALKYDKRVNTLVFVVGTLFVGIFLSFTLFDTMFRGQYGQTSGQTIQEIEREEELLRQRDPGPAGLRISPADFQRDTTAQQDTAAAAAGTENAGR